MQKKKQYNKITKKKCYKKNIIIEKNEKKIF